MCSKVTCVIKNSMLKCVVVKLDSSEGACFVFFCFLPLYLQLLLVTVPSGLLLYTLKNKFDVQLATYPSPNQ